MKILVINAGSSTLKMQLLESKNFSYLFKGMVDPVNSDKTAHENALKILLQKLVSQKIIKNLGEIKAVGHRVVHGGEKYHQPVLINAEVIGTIHNLAKLAPLHNPANLAGILACRKHFPKIPQVAVFDTAFHQTIPEKTFLYALPYELYQKNKIRRYGFHGTSHSYIAKATIKLLKKKNAKIITCHLGNGSSITAIQNGKSVDTSMGFTPLEGVPMGTRSGDIDPAIIFHLLKLKKSPQQIEEMLNHESGLLGLSQRSGDVRKLFALSKKNNLAAKRTFEVFAYRIAKYIGAYTSALNGLDALTFTGGIGENAWYLRKKICNYLTHLNLKLDHARNQKNSLEISATASKIKTFVIKTNEEKMIAMETAKVVNNEVQISRLKRQSKF